jgi:hypothetical protein
MPRHILRLSRTGHELLLSSRAPRGICSSRQARKTADSSSLSLLQMTTEGGLRSAKDTGSVR